MHALALLLTIVALVAGQSSAWATEHTVTYTITGMSNYNTYGCQLTFTPSNSGFGTSTDSKVATIQDLRNTSGFDVQLDDGVTLRLSLNNGSSLSFNHHNRSEWI